MMDCRRAEELICRAIDGQLPDGDRVELEKHAHECAACAAFRDDLSRHDRELRAAFESPRRMAAAVADRTIAALRAESRRRVPVWPFLIPLAAAAGFLVALFAFPRTVVREVPVVKEIIKEVPKEFHGDQQPPPVKQPTGTVTLVSGRLDLRPRDAADWSACAAADAFEMGTTVRCPKESLAEIVTSEGSRVRLNGGTELQFIANRNLVLREGEIMSLIAPSRSGMDYRITTPSGSIVAKSAVVNVSCVVNPDEGKKVAERVRTIVTILEGSATVEDTSMAGATCRSAWDHEWSAPRDVEPVIATRWVHPLLVRAGADEEVGARVARMLDRIEAPHYAQEIRTFGERAGPALVTALEKPGDRRRAAAKLAADLAGPVCIPKFVTLLADPDGEVRGCAFDGLVRLSGQTFGQRRKDWVDGTFGCNSDPHRAWIRWNDERAGKRVDTK
jgi:ferric-dicitrate binding protein FerR (iron transport regulator)